MRALDGLPEVENVRFDQETEVFTVAVRKVATLPPSAIEQAIVEAGREGERAYRVTWTARALPVARPLPKEAVPFALPTIRGGEYDFGEVLGRRPAVVVFWASWCNACLHEAPVLAKLHRKFKGRVEFVSVSIDAERDHPALREVTEKLRLPYPVALDPEGSTIRSYTERGAIPLTLFVDRRGRIVDHTGNFVPGDERRLVLAVERIAN